MKIKSAILPCNCLIDTKPILSAPSKCTRPYKIDIKCQQIINNNDTIKIHYYIKTATVLNLLTNVLNEISKHIGL